MEAKSLKFSPPQHETNPETYSNMRSLLLTIPLVFTISMALATEPVPIISKGEIKGETPFPTSLWGEFSQSSDGSEANVFHWNNTDDTFAGFTMLPENTDWTKHNALRFRYYASGMTGKQFKVIIAPPSTTPQKLPPAYHHITLAVEKEGWNDVVVPLTTFESHNECPEITEIGYVLLMGYGWHLPPDQGLKLEIADLELVD